MSITVDELTALGENGATIINAGKSAGSREIRGAIRYRPSDLTTAAHLSLPIAPEKPVVLYGPDDRDTFEEIAANLRASGYPDVRVLTGGFAAYEAAGLPVQEASLEQVVPPSRPQEVQELDRRL
jgi:3-mercaptopyruvate sulfurtransferase SseA